MSPPDEPAAIATVRVAIVGGGAYAARLVELLAGTAGLPRLEITLVATRADPLAIIARHARALVRARRPDWRVEHTTTLGAGVRAAAAVVLLVRVGGLAARHWDATFPMRYGLAGDEGLGAGGFANGWRTLPVMDGIADAIAASTPGARVLNLVAPLGLTTRLLVERGLATVGLCELPTTTRDRIAASGSDAARGLAYAGLNHLGWFWPRDAAGRRALNDAVESGIVDRETYTEFGSAPLPYFYRMFRPAAAARMGLTPDPGRATTLLHLRDRLMSAMERDPGGELPEFRERSTPWFEHALVPWLAAGFAGNELRTFGNVVNGDTVPELPAETVVELEVDAGAYGIAPVASGVLPTAVARCLADAARAESLAYRAIRERDRAGMASALEALPGGVPAERVADLVRDVCDEHLGGSGPSTAG